MANSVFQVKRTSVAGRAANSTTLPNPGELAINMADQIMYSTNGTTIFEVGANNTNVRVTGNATIKAIIANGSIGTAGHVLYSNATGIYWAAASGGPGGGGGGLYKGGSATVGEAGNANNIFRINANTLSFNTTIAAGENASATGPITVASGITLTVEIGGRVSIV
jgi:hypothetical protein